MRLGRNVARTFLEYYRFTNVLPTPIVTDVSTRKGRPKTHRARSRIRNNELKVRPKTTRTNAPISYTDLSICYESGGGSSNEGSPIRYPATGATGGFYGYSFGKRQTGNIYLNQDQFSLLTIQSSKFNNLDFTNEYKVKMSTKSTKNTTGGIGGGSMTVDGRAKTAETLNIPPKPYLSIIDFNQLTRGGLDAATKNTKSPKK